MGSMHTGLEEHKEGLQKLAAFYEERAKGGVGLIVTGGFSPNLRGRLHPLSAEFSKPKHAKAHRVVTDAVHKHGGKLRYRFYMLGVTRCTRLRRAPLALKLRSRSLRRVK